MADEITFTGLSSAGGRVASVLSALLVEKIPEPPHLRAVMTEVPWQQIGSDTMSVTLDGAPVPLLLHLLKHPAAHPTALTALAVSISRSRAISASIRCRICSVSLVDLSTRLQLCRPWLMALA